MADKTAISWCDATFNPWWGCQKVSPACDHCYAERDAKRFTSGMVLWGVDSERRVFDEKHWRAPLTWAKTTPAKLGRRPRVFCASMGDWLDLDAPLSEFVRLLETIRLTPELDWLLLSKRIGNWRKRLEAAADATVGTGALNLWISQWLFASKPPANVWLGATVVNQEEADRDIPKLLMMPARVRFLSIEPMLGRVDLCEALDIWWNQSSGALERGERQFSRYGNQREPDPRLHWVIAGGESGPGARPMHPDWARSLRDQCAAAGVAFHFKQWGEHSVHEVGEDGAIEPPCSMTISGLQLWRDGMWAAPPPTTPAGEVFKDGNVFALKVGKKAAGRLLDGVEHNGFPA
jgi:protein gp37